MVYSDNQENLIPSFKILLKKNQKLKVREIDMIDSKET